MRRHRLVWCKSRVAPPLAARAAQFLCCNLGIIKDGEDVTAKASDAFAERFKDQLPQEVLSAMRELFKLDDALIEHGGEGVMDVERMKDVAAMIQGSI
ncbi:hypothetical protein ZWY2020_043032 [Hordeum vulgare]|nr:hypothetical protein ZWY2020_043032 [Hordeum vulgare]